MHRRLVQISLSLTQGNSHFLPTNKIKFSSYLSLCSLPLLRSEVKLVVVPAGCGRGRGQNARRRICPGRRHAGLRGKSGARLVVVAVVVGVVPLALADGDGGTGAPARATRCLWAGGLGAAPGCFVSPAIRNKTCHIQAGFYTFRFREWESQGIPGNSRSRKL
ncbi:hypothetical protein T492DRAFT_430776 [Pavlovales sp. CCMP2436]|nr:hypothetical protein T492DRAFT_430776 [Pavlovales sp. CCMP2436]